MRDSKLYNNIGITLTICGHPFELQGDRARGLLARGLANVLAPGATIESLDDPPQAVRISAEHLSRHHEVERKRLERTFARIVEQACGGLLPRGIDLLLLFCSGPLSWPRRVLGCETISDPLRFLDNEDLTALPTRLAVTDVLTDRRTPLYSNRDLGHLLAELTAHQESSKDWLLLDGHASTAFARCPWLDAWLNKLYPVKLPLEVLESTGMKPNPIKPQFGGTLETSRPPRHSSYDPRYFEGRRLTIPLTQQEQLRSLTRSSPLLEGQLAARCPAVRFVWGRRSGAYFKECEYADADLIAGLHEDDVKWLDSIRPVLHDIKYRTLLVLSVALDAGKAGQVWDWVVAVLADHLNANQVQRLLHIDSKYLGYNALNGTMNPDRTPILPGGLSTIVELAGFVEKELEIGTLHRTREALGGIVVPDVLGRPRVGAGLSDPYWVLAGSENDGQWRSALDLYAELEARETVFWARFRNRLAETLDAEIPQVTAVPVKPKHLKIMQPLLEDQARIIAREIEDGSLSPASTKSPGSAAYHRTYFPGSLISAGKK